MDVGVFQRNRHVGVLHRPRGYMFRPEEQNMYFHLKQDEDEDGVEMSDRASWTTQASAGDV